MSLLPTFSDTAFENVVHVLKRVFSEHEVSLVIRYGRINGNDIDLFVVADPGESYGCTQNDNLDITYVNGETFEKMIEFFDPIATEPILTGTTLLGNDCAYFQKKLLSKTPDYSAACHLLHSSACFYNWALGHLHQSDFKQAANTIRFSISYCYYAQYYFCNAKPIDYRTLEYEHSGKLLHNAKQLYKSDRVISAKEITDVMNESYLLIQKAHAKLLPSLTIRN